MATGTYAPDPFFTGFDNNGDPLNGGKLYTYLAGTTTLQATYNDVDLAPGHANANPIILDSAGRATIFLTPGSSYKFVLQDSTGAAVATRDNVSAVPATSINLDVTGTAGEALTAGQVVYLSDGSASKSAGQWYKADSANTYSCLTAAVGMVPASIASAASGTIRLAGQVPGLSALVVGTTYYVGASGALTSTAPTFRRELGKADTTSSLVLEPWATKTAPAANNLCQGRLTLTTATPVTTADVTGATNVFFSPYGGNRISLYDGTDTWNVRTFSEITLALGTLVNAQAYDIFAYDSAGVVTLETAEWANATVTMTIAAPTVVTWTTHGMSTGNSITFTTTGTLPTGITANTEYWINKVDANTFNLATSLANLASATYVAGTVSQAGTHTGHQPQARATALVLQDGVLSKTGALTRRYLGTFLTTSTTTTEDSLAKRFVWNYSNRVKRQLRVFEGTDTWTYSTATWRQANGSTANQVAVVVGVAEVLVDARLQVGASNSNAGIPVAVSLKEDTVGQPAATTAFTSVHTPVAGYVVTIVAGLSTYPTVGYHAYIWQEWSFATVTTTWYGDNSSAVSGPNSGILGSIDG